MLTREQILTMPAEQLAEVSARMMGWVDEEGYWESFDGHGVLDVYKRHADWRPHTDHNDAREVADWVCDHWASLTHPMGEKFNLSDPRDGIEMAFDEIRETMNYHWAWTPEQLTRAALLAFVDNGGEIE